MGIAYSQQKQIYAQFRADTAAHIVADLDTILGGVGWTNKTATSGGWKYSILSPQGLTCKVMIADKGAQVGPFRAPAVTIQLMSNDELSVGMEHHLVYSYPPYVALGYQIIAGYTQFFISLPGLTDGGDTGFFSHSISGGIPHIPDGTSVDCTSDASGVISQCWWSCASGDSAFGPEPNFRNSLWCRSYFSFNLNGVVTMAVGAEGPQSGSLQLYTLKPTYNTELTTTPLTVLYGSGVPLDLDAFIGWTSFIRGQVWDAFLRTKSVVIDSIITTIEIDGDGAIYQVIWKCYNNTPWGSLFLRISDLTPASDDGWNYAY